MKVKVDAEKIRELSGLEDISVEQKLLKACEELGELSAAVLASTNSLNASASAEDNVLEEGVDALICVLDVLFASGYEIDEINREIARKNTKWSKKIYSRMNPDRAYPVE